ncbi:FAD-dependent oxidoreductase, partial [Zavarzinia sp.]|uniref:FAD-dependent oxidoreductase n=1 Tax=Zavarzinia sp. TaxID=2027920 RepID=UPI003BB6174A
MQTINRRRLLASAGATIFMMAAGSPAFAVNLRFQVVVYGATSAGVFAACAAAREGMKVALVVGPNPIGGMTANGLSRADANEKQPIGGMTGAFFKAMGTAYGLPSAFRFEPHVAESYYRGLLDDAEVTVFTQDTLERNPLYMDGNRIKYIILEDSTHLVGDVYVDCSYEGDLMAAAGVSYEYGRDGQEKYGEPTAGFGLAQKVVTKVKVRTASGALMPMVKPFPTTAIGAGDRAVMGFNYRLCLTDDPADRRPFEKPAGYNSNWYLLDLAKGFTRDGLHAGGELPGLDKVDRNNDEAPGENWGYPTGTRARRKSITDFHRRYQAGRLYFYGNDPRVPQYFRDSTNTWGLARSEFTDNDNWPRQLYIREGRRMKGMYKFNQADTNAGARFDDGVLLWGYDYDSHPVQNLEGPNGELVIEGSNTAETPGMGAKRYHLPLRFSHEGRQLQLPDGAGLYDGGRSRRHLRRPRGQGQGRGAGRRPAGRGHRPQGLRRDSVGMQSISSGVVPAKAGTSRREGALAGSRSRPSPIGAKIMDSPFWLIVIQALNGHQRRRSRLAVGCFP